jgi:hypothetical protein
MNRANEETNRQEDSHRIPYYIITSAMMIGMLDKGRKGLLAVLM